MSYYGRARKTTLKNSVRNNFDTFAKQAWRTIIIGAQGTPNTRFLERKTMNTRLIRTATLLAVGLLIAPVSAQSTKSTPARLHARADGTIEAHGKTFNDWGEYYRSDEFRLQGRRCGTQSSGPGTELGGSSGDCTFSLTNPAAVYDPTVATYQIPIVVHVIRQNDGVTGHISEAMVQSQILILSEDFQAIAGTNGANGTDVRIEFVLASTDPGGNPTNGITYSNNTTWYNDGGSYWDSLAWDTSEYMNVYTNSAGGALGYVPNLPQGGISGSNSDRVVVYWEAFGLNAPIGPPFDLGRTLTHEVGHYLGLEHTFSGGCGSAAACFTTGDLICDTLPEAAPTNGCSDSGSCGDPDPIDNYMDYSDDFCMEMFTPEQSRRMRCSLEHYRPDVYQVIDAVCGNGVIEFGEECDDGNATPGDGCDDLCQLEHTCGDGTTEPGEECDDGNVTPGDGCDENCMNEPVCGNGVIEAGEDCEPPGTPTCDANCQRIPMCGDGILDQGEECDDGNGTSGDGCDASCVLEGNNCCDDTHGAGCNNPTIESCVCAQDAFCCDTDWDGLCVTNVETLGCGSCSGGGGPCPGSGDCYVDNGTPGCDDAACCNAVCAADAFCCDDNWDQLCADAAPGLCGGGGGSCAPSCGKDNMECLSGPEYDNRMPIGQILLNGSTWCTAWIVAGPNILMTNQHCTEGSIAGMTVRFNYECDACLNGSPKVTDDYTVTELIHENASLDYALIRLSGNPAATWGVARVDDAPPLVGQSIYEIHHGDGLVKGHDSGQITSVDIPGTCILGTQAEIGVSAIATGGASGSPIFSSDSHCVVGICHCGPPCTAGWGVPMSFIFPDAMPHILAAGGALNDCTNCELPCSDGDACTVEDDCVGGSCQGTAVDCSASGDDCNTASCNPGGPDGNCDVLATTNEGQPCDGGIGVCVSGTCTPAGNTRLFMARPGQHAGAPSSGPTTITVVPGGSTTVEVWVADTDPQLLGGFQVALPGDATGQAGSTGTVSYMPGSAALDTGHSSWVFASNPSAANFTSETGLPVGFAILSGLPLGDGVAVSGLAYLGQFGVTASANATGSFAMAVLPDGAPPNGGTALLNETAVSPVVSAFQSLQIEVGDSCSITADCGDTDGNGITDDNCKWYECDASSCVELDRVFGDAGGSFGTCLIDGFANIHDRNHVLNCFAGTNSCAPLNHDIGGSFGECDPDGFCNIHDGNHTLNAFAGVSTCSCPIGPMPEGPTPSGGAATIRTVPSRRVVSPNDRVQVRVFVDEPLDDLQSYQLHMISSGGVSGHLALVGVDIETRKDGALQAGPNRFEAFNVTSGQMLAGRALSGIRTTAGAYLATFTYAASKDAVGTFVIDVLHDEAAGDQTFLISSGNARIEPTAIPAVISVGKHVQERRSR